MKLVAWGVVGLVAVGCLPKKADQPSGLPVSEIPQIVDQESDAADSQLISDVAGLYKQLFNAEYMTKLDDVAAFKVARVDAVRVPFSGEWYPEKAGGTNIGGPNELTALEKYDKAFNSGKPLAVSWEGLNHSKSESWYGHCNGFAASAARHQDPKNRVARPEGCAQTDPASCVYFERYDIRALLAEVYMSAKYRFISGDRCRDSKETLSSRPQDRDNPLVLDACNDLNPGSFHLALVNFIGKQKQVLVFDYTRDVQVWNYPVFGYSSVLGARLSREEATVATARSGAKDYEFNKAAKSFITVQTNVEFANAIHVHIPGEATLSPNVQVYDYILELDQNDKILGGEWLGPRQGNVRDSRVDHPDFLWIPFEPFEPNGSRNFGNPHVKPAEVIRIWAESMGFNKDNPFKDSLNPNKIFNEPVSNKTWGQFNDFSVTVDGTASGAAFLDKKTVVVIKRNSLLQGDVILSLSLNGFSLGDFQGSGTQDMVLSLDAQVGLNALEFVWHQKEVATTLVQGNLLFFGMR